MYLCFWVAASAPLTSLATQLSLIPPKILATFLWKSRRISSCSTKKVGLVLERLRLLVPAREYFSRLNSWDGDFPAHWFVWCSIPNCFVLEKRLVLGWACLCSLWRRAFIMQSQSSLLAFAVRNCCPSLPTKSVCSLHLQLSKQNDYETPMSDLGVDSYLFCAECCSTRTNVKYPRVLFAFQTKSLIIINLDRWSPN